MHFFRTLRSATLAFLLTAPLLGEAAQADPPLQPSGVSQLAGKAFHRGSPLPEWSLPLAEIPPATRNMPVVLRLAETQVRVGGDDGYLVHRAIQVNHSSALSAIGQYPLHFVPHFQQLHLHALQVMRGGEILDRIDQVAIRFLDREAGLEQGMYSGTVTAMLLIDDVRVGDTLRIVYSTRGRNPVFGETYSHMVSWDQPEATDLRLVSVISDRPLRWRLLGDHRPTDIRPVESRSSDTYLWRFEERGMAGLEEEPFIPSDYLAARFLQLTEYRDWNAIAHWADELFPPKPALPEEMTVLIERWRLLDDRQEQVAAALQWVQDEIRYFSVSLGESSHRPHSPTEVVSRRYGDCKDKTYLLVTLLHELGFEARPVLVSLSSPRTPSRLLPAPEAFDHVVAQVEVDGETYYLDATRMGQRGRLSLMAPALAGAAGLVVDGMTNKLVSLVAPSAAALDTDELREVLTLPSFEGDARLQVAQAWHGAAAEYLRVAFNRMTPQQLSEAVSGPYERRYPGIRVDGAPRVTDDPGRNRLSVEASLVVPAPAKAFDEEWAVHFFPNNVSGSLNLPDKLTRNFPVHVANPSYRASYHLTIQWPNDVRMLADPDMQRLGSDFLSAEVERSFRGNTSTLSLRYAPRVETISPQDLRRLLEDVRKLERMIAGYVAVPRSAISAAGANKAPPLSLQASIRARLDRAIERTTRAIENGRLTGEDLAEALCSRAESHADRGTAAEGLSDAEEAVRVAPASGRAWQCRGNLLFATGAYRNAVADYTKALALGHDPFPVLYRRGHARYYAGQFKGAAEDFAKAAAAAEQDNPADATYARLWLVWALQRSGRPLPGDLVSKATRDAAGDWPRPALAMVIGAVSPDSVLAQIHSKEGDDRQMALAEAWFYVGQHLLGQGQVVQAREAFEQSHAQGITVYLEHQAAAIELSRLNDQRP